MQILEEYGDVIIAIICGATSLSLSIALLPIIGTFVSDILSMLMG